ERADADQNRIRIRAGDETPAAADIRAERRPLALDLSTNDAGGTQRPRGPLRNTVQSWTFALYGSHSERFSWPGSARRHVPRKTGRGARDTATSAASFASFERWPRADTTPSRSGRR